MSLGLVGRKVGMMRIFNEDGSSVPVTVLDCAGNRIIQIRTPDTDGYCAIQVAYGKRRASHGNSRSHNSAGSIGAAQDPGRVLPGKKMAGHLGDNQRTVQLLEVARVDVERGLLMIKGSVPGAKNGSITVHPSVKAKAVKGGAK